MNKKNTLAIGILGAGHWGPNLVRNFLLHPDCDLRWICDNNPSRVKELKSHYPEVPILKDWEEALRSHPSDAVVICTPTASHYRLAKEALQLGKHVLVEKPLTHSFKSAKELVELAREKKRRLMVGHVFLFHPAIEKTKQLISDGVLGDIYYAYSTRTNLGPIRVDVNALWDLASHDISILLYLFEKFPLSVSCQGASFINLPVEDVVTAQLRFPKGIYASLHASWLNPKKVRNLVIVGSKKMLLFDDMDTKEPLKLYDKSVKAKVSKSVINDSIHHFRKSIFEGEMEALAIPPSEPLKRECEAFINSCLHHQNFQTRTSQSSGEFGATVVEILQGMQKSMQALGLEIELTQHKIKPGSTEPRGPQRRLPEITS